MPVFHLFYINLFQDFIYVGKQKEDENQLQNQEDAILPGKYRRIFLDKNV